jgi:hypothetical protein
MNDTLKATGAVDIQVFENGKLVDRIRENNLVVTLGKTNIAKLLGGDAAGKPITQISVGDSNNTATVGDTVITDAFTKAITGVSYPDAQSVMISFEIENSEANGLTIREFGLLNPDNVLCARKVRDSQILKSNAIRLVGTWTITIN